MPSIHGKTVKASLALGIDKPCKKRLRNIVPFLLQPPKQLLSVGGQWVVCLHSTAKLSPQLFDGIQVRTVGWPYHAGDATYCTKALTALDLCSVALSS